MLVTTVEKTYLLASFGQQAFKAAAQTAAPISYLTEMTSREPSGVYPSLSSHSS